MISADVWRPAARWASLAIALVAATAVDAAPFSTDIQATSGIFFDAPFAAGELSGSGTQAGAISLTSGGALTSSPYTGSTIGANPLTGTPTDIGDGFAFDGTASATGTGAFGIGIGSPINDVDLFLDFLNGSATITYRISLAIAATNAVNSTGADAFADSEFSLLNNGTEFFFTDLVSDTVNGNSVDGTSTGSFGGPVSAAPATSVFFDLAPGAETRISGFWTLRGGAFVVDAFAGSEFTASVTIAGVRPLDGQPPPANVPLPGTFALLIAALTAFGMTRARIAPRR